MSSGLILVLVVAGSYLAARIAFDWLARRFFIVSGAEYLLLGILLGPQVSGLLSPSTVESFAPIITLGLGWMGALIGVRLVLPALLRIPAMLYRTALVESLLSLVVISAAVTYALHWQFGIEIATAVIPGVALGAIGVASAESGVAVVARQIRGQHAIVRQLQVSTAMNAFVAVVTFGLLLAFEHQTPGTIGRPITPTEWAVISVAIGAVGGILFHLFVGAERKVDRLFISLGGAIILVSGAATYLRLSPLLAAMCFGAVLANSTRARSEITGALERVERPLYFALLIFGGASWAPSTRSWYLPVALFVAVRTLSKIGSSRLSARANGVLPALGSHWGRGLLGQGGLALALALNYAHTDALVLPNIVVTAAIASVLLTDLLSARFVRSLLGVEPLVQRPSGERAIVWPGEREAMETERAARQERAEHEQAPMGEAAASPGSTVERG